MSTKCLAIVLAVLAFAPLPAAAQAYPAKPIRVLLPFARS